MTKPMLLWRKKEFPINWQQEFRTENDLHLEVGFGDGRYTAFRAKQEPNHSYVGLEISGSSLYRALKRINAEQITNVRLIKVRADFALKNLFSVNSLSSIVVNFPDPWPKDRHEKNRLLQDSFYKLAASRLKTGGEIRLATDHKKYFDFARAQTKLSGLFELVEKPVPEAVFETKYALKWKKQGKPLYYQVFKYNGNKAPEYQGLERFKDMPHAVLEGEMPEKFSFSKQVLKYGLGHIVLHEVAKSYDYNDETLERYLVRASVDEPDLNQQVLVVIRRKVGREYLVRLESFGDPIITKTARGAVHAVTEWMLTLPSDLEIKERNY